MTTLHVHLDESGDLTFSPRGSRHYLFAVAWTYDPGPLARDLTALRFGLIKQGHNLDAFHACEDKQADRDQVVALMTGYNTWKYAGLVVEKRMVNPAIREPHDFYPKFASMLLRFVLRGRVQRNTSRVLIYTDTLPMSQRRRAVETAIRATCETELAARPVSLPFMSLHHSRQSNTWIQVADYCAWALFKKWESGDTRTYDQIRSRLAATELHVTKQGDGTVYY
jgi:hypothetical protein